MECVCACAIVMCCCSLCVVLCCFVLTCNIQCSLSWYINRVRVTEICCWCSITWNRYRGTFSVTYMQKKRKENTKIERHAMGTSTWMVRAMAEYHTACLCLCLCLLCLFCVCVLLLLVRLCVLLCCYLQHFVHHIYLVHQLVMETVYSMETPHNDKKTTKHTNQRSETHRRRGRGSTPRDTRKVQRSICPVTHWSTTCQTSTRPLMSVRHDPSECGAARRGGAGTLTLCVVCALSCYPSSNISSFLASHKS